VRNGVEMVAEKWQDEKIQKPSQVLLNSFRVVGRNEMLSEAKCYPKRNTIRNEGGGASVFVGPTVSRNPKIRKCVVGRRKAPPTTIGFAKARRIALVASRPTPHAPPLVSVPVPVLPAQLRRTSCYILYILFLLYI
jgi:hypothetical protein